MSRRARRVWSALRSVTQMLFLHRSRSETMARNLLVCGTCADLVFPRRCDILVFLFLTSCSEEAHEAGLDDERGVEEHVRISGAAVGPDRHGKTSTAATKTGSGFTGETLICRMLKHAA